MQYLIMCRSLTHAQRAAALLERRGITASVIKAPQNLRTEGCGYAVSIYKRFNEARMILRSAGLLNGKTYVKDDDGSFREIAYDLS